VAEPYGKLKKYLDGLDVNDRDDVFAKLKQAGYAKPCYEDEVASLTKDDLERIGIEPHALRSKLLKSITLSGGLLAELLSWRSLVC
jgi:hypothetical protein